jgi:alpha-L-fucosidase 2
MWKRTVMEGGLSTSWRLLSTLVVVLLVTEVRVITGDTKLWYQHPASGWEEALPIGNGRIGAMVFGGVNEEHLQLNEGNIWSGRLKPYDRVGAHKHFPAIRKLIYEERHKEAENLIKQKVLGERPLGCYQPLGDLHLSFDEADAVSEYKRDLDLDTAVAGVTYRVGDTVFTREIFSSVPDQVIVIRLTCDKPGRLTFTAQLRREVDAEAGSKGGAGLVLRGQADRGKSSEGTRFVGRLEAVAEGGGVSSQDGVLRVENADAVTLFLSAASDYRSEDFEAQCEKQLAAAVARPYEALREAHVKEHQRLFRRVTLDLGKAPDLPTNERLRLFKQGAQDPALMALYFQYGRYLLISASRPGNLPATLQGLWNKELAPPWFCGWHFDINVQMNYWLAETTNLSECHRPFLDLIDAMRINGRKTARDVYGTEGFVFAHRTTGILFTAPVHGLTIWPTGAAWSCQHLWEHYLFTQDNAFLSKKGYPIMKEAATFLLGWLSPNPVTGKLVSGPSISPENRFATDQGHAVVDMGPAMDQQIAAELFDHCLAAAAVLGIEDDFTRRVKAARNNLATGLNVGSDGRLLEWSTERGEREPGHRHLSHLYAAYPGNEVTLRGTPAFAEAVRKSLVYRIEHGGKSHGNNLSNTSNTGWALGWIINLWARLGDGDQALVGIDNLLRNATWPNLMDSHPSRKYENGVFQIDGNLGGTAGIAEMLLQSHAGEIELLPALPDAWQEGSVTGLRARGGFEVDLEWSSGRLSAARIRASEGGTCSVRYSGQVIQLNIEPGEAVILDAVSLTNL